VKRSNAYSCLATEEFRFLDVINFLAPGCNYDRFIKAYDCQATKGYFCYEYLDCIEKLQDRQLPPHEAFYSKLKGSNITKDQYEECQKTWRDNNMQSLQDFLVHYNNLDTAPFCEALEKMRQFYKEMGVDLFKNVISAPGIARKVLFDDAGEAAHFALPDKWNINLYETLKKNLVGGPSIIFHRHQENGKTFIRNRKLCKRIIGYDSNALYLFAFGQNMPCGPFTIRREETNFRKEKKDKYMQAYYWLEWLIHKEGKHIQHGFNGKEKYIEPYRVDGYCSETQEIYELDGCHFHGHQCELTSKRNEEWQKKSAQIRERDRVRKEYLESLGYKIRTMRSCDFDDLKRSNVELQDFLKRFDRPTDKIPTMTVPYILQLVKQEKLFGAVEVDIHVPPELHDKFDEMSPLFANVDVPFDCIGEHMQNYVRENELDDTKRRLLVGGMKGKKMLVATPLLKWYLEHGLEVTRVHQIIEFTPNPCFKNFTDKISDARRTGDVDPSKAIIADTMKLLGNSAYGSMIMDKTRHQTVKYINGVHKAHMAVNNPKF
jgi:very-short-patch-repair endonuclease